MKKILLTFLIVFLGYGSMSFAKVDMPEDLKEAIVEFKELYSDYNVIVSNDDFEAVMEELYKANEKLAKGQEVNSLIVVLKEDPLCEIRGGCEDDSEASKSTNQLEQSLVKMNSSLSW